MNIALRRAVRIVDPGARKWRDDRKGPWLDSVPMIATPDVKKTSRGEPSPPTSRHCLTQSRSSDDAAAPPRLHRTRFSCTD
jgi:hypothetical protein